MSSVIITILGLLLIPVLDPVTSRRVGALRRARRVRHIRLNPKPVDRGESLSTYHAAHMLGVCAGPSVSRTMTLAGYRPHFIFSDPHWYTSDVLAVATHLRSLGPS